MGTVYVVDYGNRVLRWPKGAASGSIIIGQQGAGDGAAQLSDPTDLAFDRQGNLYVVDRSNQRVQMFLIDKSSCLKGTYKENNVIWSTRTCLCFLYIVPA